MYEGSFVNINTKTATNVRWLVLCAYLMAQKHRQINVNASQTKYYNYTIVVVLNVWFITANYENNGLRRWYFLHATK